MLKEITMKKSKWLVAAALALTAAAAQAHTHLKNSVPAEGSVVNTAPANIVLKFSEAARVTALTLQKDGAAEQKLGPLPSDPSAEISVPAPKLEPGKYVVSYRVMGKDNHVMSGKVQFTLDPKATASAGKPTDHEHKH
jgi:methionine-rich copper-binding protein CopC